MIRSFCRSNIYSLQKKNTYYLSLGKRSYSAGAKACFEQVKALNEKSTKPASHLIINLDGVVLDSVRRTQDSHDLYLMKWKKVLTREQKVEIMGRRNREAGEVVTKDLNLPFDGDVYAFGVWQIQRDFFRQLKQQKGVKELVCYFHEHDIPIALITSSHRKAYEIKTKPHQDIIEMFCHEVLGDDPEVKKGLPSPDILKVAASRFHNGPKEMHKYVLIDSSINGIKAAEALGMQSVLYPDRLIPDSLFKKANVVITSLTKFEPSDFEFPMK